MGLKCLFTTQRINSSGMRQYRLHEMNLHSDFVETLRGMGKIPKVNLNHVIELTEEKKRKQDQLVKKLKEAMADPARKAALEANPEFQKIIEDNQELKKELELALA